MLTVELCWGLNSSLKQAFCGRVRIFNLKLNSNLNKSRSNVWIGYNSWTKYVGRAYEFDDITN